MTTNAVTDKKGQPMSYAHQKQKRMSLQAWIRGNGTVLAIAMAAVFGALAAHAADLVIDEGVVVKFGSSAGVVVRDNVQTGRQTIFTSFKDDTAAGQTGMAPQIPAAGDWTGLKLEASVPVLNARLQGSSIRYSTIGLDIRKIAPTLTNLEITNSMIGVHLTDGAAVKFNGLSLTNNATGAEVSNAAPVFSQSQIQGNSVFGIANLTSATAVTATGNWWGDASGPKDSTGNPTGLGDGVSAGVTYGSWLAQIPLIDPAIKLAGNLAFTEQQSITLELYCRNASEYRVVEGSNFTGVLFQPMVASVPFMLSAGEGNKQISVQYRASTGNIVTATLPQGVIYDTQGPVLAITNPAEGSYITSAITLSATASDVSGIAKLDFFVDGLLVSTDTSAPYSYYWNAPGVADGSHNISVVATDAVGHISIDTRNIIVARAVPPPPDTSGPALSGLTLSGTAIAAGSTLVRSGSLAISVSDPSGISRVEFLLDGVLLSTDTNGADGFATYLDLGAIVDGSHTLTVRAYDSLGNFSEASTAVVVTLAAPATPSVTAPANGLVTNLASVTVAGTAELNSQVVVHNNAVQVAGPVNVDAAGKFSLPVTLAEGVNSIQVAAMNRGGASALTTARQVTLDTSIPLTPLGLNATAQAAGKIRLTWSRVLDANATGYNLYRSSVAFNVIAEAAKINAAVIPVATTTFDDLPKVDGIYYYRIVAVNNLGTASSPSNQISAASDNTLPSALEVLYAPTGKTDPVTGRVGAGRVDVTVRVSEPLAAAPFLSIAPQNGVPIAVDLVRQTDTEYRGFFNIAPGTPSGMAYAVFSARDVVGNRGTQIAAGLSINIDAQGPSLTGLVLTPASPIKNDATAPVTASLNLTFSEAQKSGAPPQLSYTLSGSPLMPISVTSLTQTGALTWTGSFALPANAGQTQSEQLTFAYSGLDDLDNVSTTITATNSFQVYQGSLPPLTTPLDFAVTAQPAGKVRISWRAVNTAIGYQLYRQAPGEAALTAFQRVMTGLEYIDSTTADGLYRYTIASIRDANGQESISTQSAIAEVTADSVAPAAPQNMALLLVGAGIQSTWQAPVGGAASYNLYRSGAASITDVTGLTPIKTKIPQLGAIDPSPSASEHAYAVTALDAAGNESPVSNSVYLNFTLLPVATLTVVQSDAELPVISWTHKNPSAIAGYNVYLGSDSSGTLLNLTPLQTLSYTDTGYAGDERPYTVVAFDNNGAQIGRALMLPKLSAEPVSGAPLQRNVMNRLQYRVTNQGTTAVSGVHMKAKIGTRETSSEAFSLAPSESKLIGVVVGGHADIPSTAVLTSTIDFVPNEGERVSIVRNSNIAAQDGSLVLTVAPENFIRGGIGKTRFTLENTSDVDIEILTANANGSSPSPDIRYKLIDKDGNVLATQSFKQVLGGNVITLATGQTVARLTARASFTSDPMDLAVPAAAPDSVTVQLEVDRIHYRLGTPETVSIAGLKGRQATSLSDTPYYGEITSITPASSFGDQDIVISGRAIARASLQPIGNMPLKLVFSINGFERKFDLFSDATGSFTYNFKPTAADGGAYKVSILHPDILVRPVHGQFVINSVVVSPTGFNLTNPRNYPYTIKFHATAGEGTTATNVRAVYEGQYQPSGSPPPGINVTIGAPLTLASKQAGDLLVTVTGDNSAAETGSLFIKVLVDEKGVDPVASIRINYKLTDAKPVLAPSPSYVETGLAQGGSTLEQVTLENRGFAEAQGVTATLLNSDGTPAPTWIYLLGGSNLGNLAIGEKRTLDIAIAPPDTFAEGIYTYKLRIAAANATGGDIPVYVSITQSGIGNALFKASDIYTGTLNPSGQRIPGLAGARITVQNELVPSDIPAINTDSLGEAYFTNLPAGSYKFRATALNHQEVIGRITVKPGITATQDVFLDYNLVTVQWSVTDIAIQDIYQIVLTATYETNVPAAVIVLEPTSVTLPNMKAGDVFLGEMTLTNYGLVRADKVRQTLPASDPYIRFEFLATIPDTLDAKSRITLPYRAVSLQSFDPAATATGGGCFSYGASTKVACEYGCANGNVASANTSAGWSYFSGSGCGGGVGGPTFPFGGGTGSFDPIYGGGSEQIIPSSAPPCKGCKKPKCCERQGGGPGGPGGPSE